MYAYLERGVLAGVIAGIAYGLYMAVVANPLVEYMEGVAHGDHGHGHGHAEHASAVSETTTALVGVGSGILWGVLLGGLFALAFYFFEPALPGSRTVKSLVLAGSGYLTVSVAPWLVLPPAAPGAEQTVGTTAGIAIYAGMMIVGALVAVTAVLGYNRTASRNRLLGVAVGAIPVVALVTVVPIVTPTIITHSEIAATLIAAYQGLAVLSQAALWLGIAGCFSWLLGYVETTDGVAQLDEDLVTDS